MSKKIFLGLALMLLAFAGLTACTPTCGPGSLESPVLVSPDWREVVDGAAMNAEWSYPDPSCEPDRFEINLSKDRDFSVIEHSHLSAGDKSSWIPPTLDAAEEYFWRVRAKVGSTYGPYSSEQRSFFTLPYCTAADLAFPPSLVYPPAGGFFDRGSDSLEWEWQIASCIPESYRIEVSMDSGFVDTTYNGATSSPGTRWGFGSTPPAATIFWWRVSAFSDGFWGPPSAVHTFSTDPACTAASLVEAVSLTPLDDEVVPTGNPEFTWSYPDGSCTPEGYHLRVFYSWDWDSYALDSYNPNSANNLFQAGVPVPDCNDYLWQISMISEGIEGPLNVGQRFIVDSGSCDCAPGASTTPMLLAPGGFEILPDTNAELVWDNPGGCFSDGQSVKISTDYDFSDISVEEMIPQPGNESFTPPGLDPATQYYWKVAYYVDDAGSPVIGDYSGGRSFFTGPECTSLAEVIAPVLVSPTDGSIVDTLTPALHYTPGIPGCIPDGYLVELHELADFSDPNLLTEYGIPATTVLTEPLTDCTTYYWSVIAIQDGGYGPESDQGSFSVDLDGSCRRGVPGTAKSNTFCREGTYEVFEALATIMTGDRVLAIARNPLTTYLKLTILDQDTKEPFKHEIHCWSYIGNFEPGWPETPAGREYFFEDLPPLNPPNPPVEPTKIPGCHEKLDQTACEAAGGSYDTGQNKCICLDP